MLHAAINNDANNHSNTSMSSSSVTFGTQPDAKERTAFGRLF